MKVIKIHGVENHLLNKIKKFNGIGSFVEDFIEQAYQFGTLNEKRTSKMRDRKKDVAHHSIIEWISINGDVKNKIIEVKHNTRRKRKTTTNIFVTQKN